MRTWLRAWRRITDSRSVWVEVRWSEIELAKAIGYRVTTIGTVTKARSNVVLLALVASVVADADGDQETVAIGDLDVPVVQRL